MGILLAAGCAVQPQRLAVCPGKASVEEALQTLSARARSAVPVWANGQAILTYHVPDKEKPERHSLDVILRYDPPERIYLQGSVTAVPKAVVMGSNDQEFWLALRPKEISSYYQARWQDVQDFAGLVLSPRIVLEAIGLVFEPGVEPQAASWVLRNQGPYDIVTRRDAAGRPVKRIYIYACDYTVRKIEYFDAAGNVAAMAQLDHYQPVTRDFPVPTRIDITAMRSEGRKDTVVLDLNPPKTKPFNEAQRQFLFNPPPDIDRFEHVYHYEQGRWVQE